MALSQQLPEKNYAINLCQDRYLFIVAYLAVCIRQQTSLLPPNQAPNTLQKLSTDYPNSYRISDDQTKADIYISHSQLKKSTQPFPLINLDSPLSISFTSGSTGEPKAIQKTWREFQTSAHLALQRLQLQNQAITLVSTVPMQHMYGLETSFFWVLLSQMTLHNSRPFYPQDINTQLLGLMSDKILVSTPRHLKICSQMTVPWADIKFILSSTAPMSTTLAEEIEHQLEAPVLELFGSTETLSFASRRTTKSPLWQPYDSIQLIKKQAQFMLQGGHINPPVILDDDFSINSQGFFTLLGRSADSLKMAGKRASLAELNQILLSIEGVEDGIFFTNQHERLSAFIVSKLSKPFILQQLKQSIDDVFLPRIIYFIPKLPRNDIGKLIKTELDLLIQIYQRGRK